MDIARGARKACWDSACSMYGKDVRTRIVQLVPQGPRVHHELLGTQPTQGDHPG